MGDLFSPPLLPLSLWTLPFQLLSGIQMELLFPLLFPPPSGSCQEAPLSWPPTAFVTPGVPVHHLKCIFMETCNFEENTQKGNSEGAGALAG